MKKHLGVDLFSYNDNRHPMDYMKDFGIKWQGQTPQSMADEFWFWNCENIPDKLPPWVFELKLDPMDSVGHGLSLEGAKAIKNQEADNVVG